jgi:putative ATPase
LGYDFSKNIDQVMSQPLAISIRPKILSDYIGQTHLVGPGKPLRLAIEQKHVFSFLLWGPPGVGKTTLARIYAESIGAEFFELSAVSAGKDDIRKIVQKPLPGGQEPAPILFLDEIHRFNKAQQDFLLPYVESGKLVLIGATTENPSFEVIPALLSRCRVFVLEELNEEQMREVIFRAIQAVTPGSTLGNPATFLDENTISWLISVANGDARQAIGMVENTHLLYGELNLENFKNALQSKFLRYDKAGEEHYNVISAFIKSLRASQVDAAMYYLARMVEAGEDPKFIARRMVIFASEDIGLAQPTALVVANAVFRATETIGYPECAINLAHGVAYLAKAPKHRGVYDALRSAQADVKQFGNLPVPMMLRNAPTKLMKDQGYSLGYEMYSKESFLPDELQDKKYF